MTSMNHKQREALDDAFNLADDIIEAAFHLIERKWPDIKSPPAEMVLEVSKMIAGLMK